MAYRFRRYTVIDLFGCTSEFLAIVETEVYSLSMNLFMASALIVSISSVALSFASQYGVTVCNRFAAECFFELTIYLLAMSLGDNYKPP